MTSTAMTSPARPIAISPMGRPPADDFLLRPKRKCLYSRHTHSPARVAGKKKQGGPNGPPFLLTLSSGEKSALDKTADIARLIEPTLQAMGFELVRVQFGGGQHRPTLQIMAERIDRQPMARLGNAEEIAWLGVYLASDESSYTTGQVHLADGGFAL